LWLLDYNTRVVLVGTAILGMCCGIVGTHLFLRRRALLGDVVSHAALPGVCLAFLINEAWRPGSGKSLSGLMLGAAASAVAGVACLEGIRRTRRLPEDAALAIVLSLFFGLGVVLLSAIQRLPTGSAAGLADFLFGKPAGLLLGDVLLIGGLSALVLVVCGLLWKELIVVSFDASFAATQGWPVRSLDLLVVLLVTAVVVIGMQCVGLLLVVALLIIPPAAARYWTDRVSSLVMISGAIGAVSAAAGVLLSAIIPKLATGAVIVLCAAAAFTLSLVFGRQRGIFHRWLEQRRASQTAGRYDLLRAAFELVERRLEETGSTQDATAPDWTMSDLAAMRNWTQGRLPQIWHSALADGLIRADAGGRFHLTAEGARQARAAARKHRLWELYLIRYADRHPVDVDPAADVAEHMLDPLIERELESLLTPTTAESTVPINPHEGQTPIVSHTEAKP
jgi:manganese/zinc/iron transport system permease protein